MKNQTAFQDQIPNNHCFGCGAANDGGLQIKSFWRNQNESVCSFVPAQHHCAGPTQILNGGIISTIIDCHCVCTAIAKAYDLENRAIGTGEPIWFATGNLQVAFRKPVSISHDVELVANISDITDNRMTLDCELYSNGKLCCTSTVLAVKVPNNWSESSH